MRPTIAWPHNGIRPYESLWLIVNRYLALNWPTRQEFAQDFFANGCWDYTGEISLTYGTRLLTRNAQRPIFNFERLARALGVHNKRLEYAAAVNLRGSLIDHLDDYLRVCPQCLNSIYHTVVFQIRWLEICPIHGERLVRECRGCGRVISTDLSNHTFQHPFSCKHCGTPIVPRGAVLNAPRVRGIAALRPLLQLYRDIARNEFAVPTNFYEKTDPKSTRVIVALLTPYSKTKLPKMLAPTLKAIRQATIFSQVRAGNGSGLEAKAINHKHPVPSSEPFAGRHYSRIFRSYRRYLKNHLNKHRLISRYFRRGADVMDKAIKENPETAVNVLALRIWTDELLDRVSVRKDNLWDHPYKNRWWHIEFEMTQPFVGLDFSDSQRIGRSPRENQWIWEHFFAAELIGLWREARIVAQHMVERDYFGTGPRLLSGSCVPSCFAMREHNAAQLEFLSWTIESDEDYRKYLRQRVESWVNARARRREIYEDLGVTFNRLMEKVQMKNAHAAPNTDST